LEFKRPILKGPSSALSGAGPASRHLLIQKIAHGFHAFSQNKVLCFLALFIATFALAALI
jgi:hypothetical protein